MPFGFGRGFGRGWGRGWGNPSPYCRNFPWLPKWWWATPNANQYSSTIPNYPNYASPYPTGYPQYNPYYDANAYPANELDMLKGQTEILEDELEGIRKRIKEIESSKTDKT
ncbi:MAG: DUF5320 domain-containing protein [bacterium]